MVTKMTMPCVDQDSNRPGSTPDPFRIQPFGLYQLLLRFEELSFEQYWMFLWGPIFPCLTNLWIYCQYLDICKYLMFQSWPTVSGPPSCNGACQVSTLKFINAFNALLLLSIISPSNMKMIMLVTMKISARFCNCNQYKLLIMIIVGLCLWSWSG